MNYDILYDKLVEGFIKYQWNLENPFPSKELMITMRNISMPIWEHQYEQDPYFRAKVRNLVSGVILTVQEAEKQSKDEK